MVQWREHLPHSNVDQVDSHTQCHMWVEFVLGFRPCSEVFSNSVQVGKVFSQCQ